MAKLFPTKKLNKYFKHYLDEFIFNELSPKALERFGAAEILENAPVPMNEQDMKDLVEGKGLSAIRLAENMIVVMGADPLFVYNDKYAEFVQKIFNGKATIGIIDAGEKSATKGKVEEACIYFRAALVLDPEIFEAMYSYAMATRAIYQAGGEEELIGNFKAESFRYLEGVTELYPDFSEAYYYLGYAYLNMGLYLKASLTWKSFLETSNDSEKRREIKERFDALKNPVEIEKGVNEIASGRFESGITTLEKFTVGEYANWWPLHYYLGIGYSACGDYNKGIEEFKRVLSLSPSHIETMEELVELYRIIGDHENEEKYLNKIELIRSENIMQ